MGRSSETAATTSHVECSAEERARMGIPEGLIRYSTGIEDPDDLIADLEHGIAGLGMTGPGIAELQLGILVNCNLTWQFSIQRRREPRVRNSRSELLWPPFSIRYA